MKTPVVLCKFYYIDQLTCTTKDLNMLSISRRFKGHFFKVSVLETSPPCVPKILNTIYGSTQHSPLPSRLSLDGEFSIGSKERMMSSSRPLGSDL